MSLLSRLKGLLKIHRLERDVEDELRAHLEMRAQDNLAAGMSPEEARYDARRFGKFHSAEGGHSRHGHRRMDRNHRSKSALRRAHASAHARLHARGNSHAGTGDR